MKQLFALAIAFFASLSLEVKIVPAQTFTWQPTAGGLYNTAANWSPAGGPPNAAGELALYTGTTTQIVVLETSLTTSGHRIENGNITYQLSGTTQSMSGGAGLVVGSVAGQTGRFTILNGTMTGDMALGNSAASVGFFTIGEDALFDAAANATTIAGSANSSGTVTITNGGDYSGTSTITLGGGTNSNGTVTASGSGSTFSAGGTTNIGDVGTGEFTLSAGATASVLTTVIGNAATGVGELLVTGAGSALTTGNQNFTVGVSGSGTLNIAAGGVVTSNNVTRIAQSAGSTGAATVSGAGSIWNASSLAVGGSLGSNGGTATLRVEDEGAVNVTGNMEIRATAGTAVTIDGGTLTVGGNFIKNGTLNLIDGTLHVTGIFDNGTVSAPLVIDGGDANDLPTLRLSSGSGTLSEVTSITVGAVNRGALVIDTGRSINLGANTLAIGAATTAEGVVTVTGSGSTISSTGTISVGGSAAIPLGTGALNITQGGAVSAGTLNLFPQATLTISGGTLSAAALNISGTPTVNFTSGRVNFTAVNSSLTGIQLDPLLGTTHELGANRTIGGGAGTLTIQAPIVLTGGTLTSGAGGTLQNSSTIEVRNGTLTGNFITNDAGKQIVVSGMGVVTAGSAITNSGTVLLDHNLVAVGAPGISFTNSGTLRGSGVVTSPVTNPGLISVIGGDMEFIGLTVNSANTGLITGRDGTLRFTGTLSNSGSLAFSGGAMDVYGDITQNAGGRITVSGGGVTTFYDDVTIAAGANNVQVSSVGNVQSAVVFLGSYNGGTTGGGAAFIEGDHRPGNSPALVNFGGDVFYGGASDLFIEIGGAAAGSQFDKVAVTNQLAVGGTLNVSLINGFAPAAGQSFDILDFATLTGTFNTLNLPALAGGLSWNTSQLYTMGTLSIVGGIPADYNNNGVVDAADYVLWRKGGPLANEVDTPGTVNAADYTAWRTRFGNTSGAGGGLMIDGAAVPEPSTVIALLMALKIGLFHTSRRRFRSSASC